MKKITTWIIDILFLICYISVTALVVFFMASFGYEGATTPFNPILEYIVFPIIIIANSVLVLFISRYFYKKDKTKIKLSKKMYIINVFIVVAPYVICIPLILLEEMGLI